MWELQLLLLAFLSVNCDIIVKQTLSFTHNSGITNKLCNDGLLVAINKTSTLQCATLCTLNDNCVSFFVNSIGICQLNSLIIYDTTICTSSHNTLYYVSKKLLVKGTTEDATTEGQTSKYIDTSSKTTTGDMSTLTVECDIGWLKLGTGCYQFTPGGTRQMWLDAKDICSANGGYLTIIETAEENVFIKDHVAIIGPTNDYFIGGSDLATEGEFIWEHTGVLVNLPGSNLFHDWRTNQPDNKNGNQHCIMLGYQVSFNWNDAQCAYGRDFICEKSPIN
ncbi:unnamed protein product [Mytilus coruscus]|uniref:C-type lectin domain-containing protein n=1 Tax=Mytilus coruscus TaxID=42192 RepID=A0A6J8AX66_MYTCO|nr:unnamed protein product [Mytilus coruscus]